MVAFGKNKSRGVNKYKKPQSFTGTRKSKQRLKAKNAKPKPSVKFDENVNVEDVDVSNMVDSEDLEFLKKAVLGNSYSFLRDPSVLGSTKPTRRSDKKRNRMGEEGGGNHWEDDYAKMRRLEGDDNVSSTMMKTKHLLPIKTSKGKLIPQTLDVPLQEYSDGELDEAKTEDDEDIVPPEEPLTAVEELARKAADLKSKKEKIARWSAKVLENPDIHSDHLSHLVGLLNPKKESLQVQRLATISLTILYKDIIPAYRIAERDTSKQLLKKETLKLWKFENSLLSSYKSFLQRLGVLIAPLKQGQDLEWTSKSQELLVKVALQGLTTLLVLHPHFNLAENIVATLMPIAAKRQTALNATKLICDTFCALFRQDTVGTISLQVVRQMYRCSKARGFQIPGLLLESIQSLRLVPVDTEEETKAQARETLNKNAGLKRRSESRRERKKLKMKREVERDLTAAQAMENTTLRQRNQTAILSVLFTMLFRVVKSPTGKSNEVLTATLGGLAKFAHFINIDFFADLVNALHDLTAADDESSALTPLQSVHVVRTVFTLLDGQGSSLNIDPHRFYLLLEKSIPEFDASTKDPDVVFPAILDTLDAALLRRRKTLTKPRVAAFLRVLVKSSLAAPTPAAAAFLLTCKTLLHAHPWAMAYLLEAEEESAGPISVIGTPRTEGASGWDLARLRSSPCEEVQLLANHLSAGCPITGPNTLPGTLGKLSPLDLFQSMSQKVS